MNSQLLRIAERLKAYITKQPGNLRDPNSPKRRLLDILNDFEGYDWLPEDFKAVLDDSAVSIPESGDVEVKAPNDFQAIADLLEGYMTRIKLKSRGIYTTKMAADYLEIKFRTIEKYMYGDGDRPPVLRGTKIGHDTIFFREDLEEFKAQRRGPGRPRKD